MAELPVNKFCTRAEAASYLCFEDPESVDARLTRNEHYTPGKLRYRIMQDEGKRKKVRILKSDVLAMLRPFEEAA